VRREGYRVCASASASPTLPCAQKTRCSSLKLFPMGQRDALMLRRNEWFMRSLVFKMRNRPRADILSEQSQMKLTRQVLLFGEIFRTFSRPRALPRGRRPRRATHTLHARARIHPRTVDTPASAFSFPRRLANREVTPSRALRELRTRRFIALFRTDVAGESLRGADRR